MQFRFLPTLKWVFSVVDEYAPKKRFSLSSSLVLSVLVSAPAPAGTSSTSFNVSVTVVKDCTITAPPAINFGNLGATALASAAPQTQTFTVLCTSGTPYSIQFSSPNDATAGTTTHQLKGGVSGNTGVIPYTLSDASSGASNTSPLGGSSSVISATGIGTVQTKALQVNLLSPSGPLSPDTYTDTVTMSVSY